ncbi:MAG: 30S ribosomal protein S17 [Anaerolineales bacterium]|nr:30S ribosomal protein S17 [Anaerolineales bacterium]
MSDRRRMTGEVTSNKMDKTVSVKITRRFRHRLYKKVIDRHNTVKAHDVLECEIGDQVLIVETQPMSKTKRWAVEKIILKAVSTEKA